MRFILLNKNKLLLRESFVRFVHSVKSDNVLHDLFDRGNILESFPPRLNSVLPPFIQDQRCVYAGFDPTADSLHVGNLVVLRTLLNLHCNGIRGIVLIGSATARLGDPSGKASTRQQLSLSDIESNALSITHQIKRVASNYASQFIGKPKLDIDSLMIVDNASWYKHMDVIGFISKYAGLTPLRALLIRASVRERMKPSGGGINVAEFIYPIIQAYDFLHLHNEYNCGLQIGGNDQLLNIDCGHDLVKLVKGVDVGGLLTPLILSSSGKKLGKTESGCLYLADWRTSPFSLYQYFMRTPDSDVALLLRFLTDLDVKEIDEAVYKSVHEEAWYAQKLLAYHVVRLVHGESGVEDALLCTQALYSGHSYSNLTPAHVQMLENGGVNVCELEFLNREKACDLVLRSGFVPKLGTILATMKSGGLRINGAKLQDPHLTLDKSELVIPSNQCTFISFGKRNHFIIKWKQ